MGDRFAGLGSASTLGSLAVVVTLAVTVAGTHAGTPPDAAGSILCRQAKAVRPKGATASAAGADTRTHPVVEVEDRFTAEAPASLQVRRTRALCLPAIEGEAIVTLAGTGFAAIDVRPPRGTERPDGGSNQLLRGAFGELTVEVNGLARLLTGATLAPGAAGTNGFEGGLSDFSCYRVQATGDDGNLGTRSFTTADGRWTLRVQKPRRLCIPANGDITDGSGASDYLCYKAKSKRGADAPARGDLVSSTTTFGQEILRVGHASELCFPTERTTIPPDDEVELAITPPAPGIEWRETADFQATATLGDGSTEDWTERVTWTSSDEDTAPLVDDGPGVSGRFRGIDPGTVTIRATDVATGATATASLTVRWSLERIVIEPAQVNRAVGQKEVYQATGHFPNGVTHNVTPRLVYSSSDPAVAAASNAAASPSRVEAMGFGTATITACDPVTDICTGPDDDAEMIVLGGLQSIRIEPGTRQAVLPGQGANFTAIGHFADGRENNLTQKVTWTSTDPGVVSAPNAAPNRGRMIGGSPGGAYIRAIDPKTGVQSPPHEVFTLGDLRNIDIIPFQARAVRPPGSRRFKALGFHGGGGFLNLTQQVEWSSETPAIGLAPNDPGDRSRIDTGGAGGFSLVRAHEPVSAITSRDAYFWSLGQLESVSVSNHIFGRFPPHNRIAVGETQLVRAHGVFESGTVNLLVFSPDTTQLVSSDPAVAEIVDGIRVRGVAPGTFTLQATDTVSGITSDEAAFIVQGDVERMELHGVTRARVGDTVGYEVRGHFSPGIVTIFTGPVDYASSNPALAQVTQSGQRKGRVQCLAPGTVTISATDPRTGVSSTDTGDDITLVILPDEPPVQVTIQPPVSRIPVGGFDDFTATAHFSSGQTLNVTQQADWSSSATAVAQITPTPEHGDSHTVGVSAGVAFVTAAYAGVSSADSGHDAVVFVDDAVEIDVYPSTAVIGLDETRTIQATAELAGGGVINVTNQVEFLSLDANVADFLDPNAPNVLTGLAVGDATLDVGFPGGARGTATISVSETTTTTSTSTTTSTTIPGGGFELVIEPADQAVDFGEDAYFSATLTGPGGTTEDVTKRVRWKVADKRIASGNGGTLATHDPGSTTVTAVDPTTGASASAANLTVRWSLDGITLYPRQVNRGVGDYERFEAIGHFPKGRDVPITGRLVYTSSAPAVASVEPNASWPSQVVAKAEGEATITACDPISSICSTAGGGDAALLVAGGLQSIELQPGGVAKQFPGGSQQYTAIGHYDDGTSVDITASVEWTSSSPAVALASNLDGTRGRVYALSAGLSFIRARDPETEIESFSQPFYTIGPIQQIFLDMPDPFQVGSSALVGATALHQGGAERNVTQQVTWGSRTPAIATAPNDPAAKNRIDGVGIGTARIFATDPSSGVTSDDGEVLVYGDLAALHAAWQGGGWPPNRVGIGGTRTYTATGIFEGGYFQRFTGGSRPFHLVSSDPAVAEVVDDTTVVGVGPGTTTITAVDDATGVTGNGAALTVQGNIQRIVLEPAMKLRGLHEYQAFTATGYFPPDGVTANVTQNLIYESSNPSVAVVFNDPAINKSTIFTVGPGTTVISATDPATGVSSSDSGDDAIVEVIDGVPDQIVISPPFAFRMLGGTEEFTAVAHYPDGTTINVTQQVEWSSSASSVAGAFLQNRKSLFRARSPGVATITATHPSGVTSTASGHDALMEVDAVRSLTIHPSFRRLEVGQTEEFTVIATLARGGERNVTQAAFYNASTYSPYVVNPFVDPNRRSLVQAVGPGVVDLFAFHGFRQTKARIIVVAVGGSPSGAFLSE
jgi:hypothetical protein